MQEVQYFDNIFQINRTTSEEKYENMENQLNEFLTHIKSQNLSPMEQIMLVYDKAKMFEYADSDTLQETKQLPDVLSNNRAESIGYTNFFNECMSRLGYKNCAIESYIGNIPHMHSLVEINDDKYGIQGIYNFDPASDSLDINSEDRTLSYAFFGRNVEEINHLRKQRIPKGVSIALMKGMDGKYDEVANENPTRTMNVIKGFFPSEENSRFIQEHFSELQDKSNWPSLNEAFLFQISNLGFKVRSSDNIPINKLEQIIANVKKTENPNLSEEQINAQMKKIKEFNNSQFSNYYNDTRLMFKVIPENYVNKENYQQILDQINSLYNSKKPDEALKTIIEFTNGQQQQAFLRVESLSGEEKKTLLNCAFDSNYEFMSKCLNPLIHSYVESFPYTSSQIGKPEYFNLNIRNYKSNSINGSSLSIIDGNLDYLQQIDSYIKSNSQKVEIPIEKGDGIQMNSKPNDNNFIPPKPNSVESIMDNPNQEELQIQTNDDVSTWMNEAPSKLDSEIQAEDNDIADLMDEAARKNDSRINQYNAYRAEVLPYLLNSDPNVCIHSDFTIGGDNGQICRHTLEKLSDESRQIIYQQDFEFDEGFKKGLLEQSIIDYGKTNSITNAKVNDYDNGLSQYSAFSETSNILTINNVSREYANYIEQEVKKINPTVFQQQMEQYQGQYQGTGGYQRTLNNNSGFSNDVLVSIIVAFVVGLVAFITYLMIKLKGIV